MALIGNYSVLNKSNTRYSNGTATAGAYVGNTRGNWNKPSVQFAKIVNSLPPQSSIPGGYNPGEAYTLAVKSGGLASFTQINGSGSLVATAIMARLSEAALSGSGQIDSASLSAVVQAVAALAGVGGLTANLGILTNMSSALSGSGSMTANLSALVGMSSNLSGSGSIVSDLRGVGSLSAEIEIGAAAPLSPEGLALSLLDNNDIETNYSLRETLRLIVSALAGKVSGGGTATVTIRDINDTVDRIVASVDSSGNRTSVTKDVD